VQQVHALQDAIKAQQKAAGTFEVPSWDQVSQKKVREALLVLASTTREDPELHPDRGGLELHRTAVSPGSEILNGTWKFPEARPAT
jgi:hypothetical protein